MNTTETIEKLKALAEECAAYRLRDNAKTIRSALTLLQNKEEDTELLNEADAMWKPGDGHCVEITWGCGTLYKTCREALSELVTAIAAQQEEESA